MPHYKSPDNSLHYIDDTSLVHLLPKGSVPITEDEAEYLRPKPKPDPKWIGIEFGGVMCSATREDQNGLMAVLLAFQMQGAAFKPTEFHFANGSKLVLSAQNIQAFTAVWMPFRQSFFAAG
jgi:hypothetical protein